jgi:hypothetical protein
MNTLAADLHYAAGYPARVDVKPALDNRNRLTTAFRMILAIPHVILVGGPIAATLSWSYTAEHGINYDWAGGGALGVVAALAAMIAWFAIIFTGRHPDGLWQLSAFYLRWRVRVMAYASLLTDDFPPFDDRRYDASLSLAPPITPRDRVSVAFRIFLAIPHVLIVWVLSFGWLVTTIVAWFAILFTGRYPASLYNFGVDVLRWNVRLEAYLLLLCDEYPPFALRTANERAI